MTHWVFGYGSLIWKADFPFRERAPGTIRGWARRFWQGSHDHRGTPSAPGRVVTLVEAEGAVCRGMAYRIEATVFDHLDHREKNGYRRVTLPIELTGAATVTGTVYLATPDNPAFLGPAPAPEIAAHILGSEGPSGRNVDYFLELVAALEQLGVDDPHLDGIHSELRRLGVEGTA